MQSVTIGSEKDTEINFGRNGKQNMDENPFARCVTGSTATSPEGSQSPITSHWVVRQPAGFFSQILLVVEPKIDFLAQKMRPDWKGPPKAGCVAMERVRAPRNPGKP